MTIPPDQLEALKREVYRQEFVRHCETDKDLIDCVIDHLAGRLLPDWQPIETAPKDGKRILLSDPYSGVGDGYYCNLRWWFYECGDDWYSEECNPTHWMPLPQPPAAKGG